MLLLLTLTACGFLETPSSLDAPTEVSEERPAPRPPTAIPLGRRAKSVVDLSLPDSSRPDATAAPDRFGLVGPLELDAQRDGVDVYRTPLPLDSSLLPTKLKGTHVFGSGAPPDLVIRDADGQVWPFARLGRAPGSFGFDRDWLYLGVSSGEAVPDWQGFAITFPRATRHEDGLNHHTANQEDAAFLSRSLTLDATSTSGLYLPAPASASWTVTVPERGVFTTRLTVLPPAIRTIQHSDGATLHAELLDGDAVVDTTTAVATPEQWADVRWDLTGHAGKELTLRLRTDPGDHALFDYVFLEEPTLYSSTENPRRTVLVFVDTLRPDHIGTYGYKAHATTPFIDRWASQAAVFEQARSVAPWTLPSARSALTGYQPEQWFDVQNVAERFGDAGWATEAIVANAFLSEPFDMHRGWSRFRYEHLLDAEGVSAAALESLARYPDRDLLLLVHYMDPHLPYEEPTSYRYTWASFRSPDGHEPSRARLYGTRTTGSELDAIRTFVQARYDQNLRYVDDQLAGVLEAAGPQATTVLFSDHGEEFWDHGSFEHGHSFHDEVLRIPLIIRGPNAPVGRYADPVSILDITPTVLEMAGLPTPDGPGISLVDRLYGTAGADTMLAERPQAFGRPLYEQDGWAVLDEGSKWIDRSGVRTVYDLTADPGETADVAHKVDLERYPDALAQGLDREVLQVWRVRPKTRLATGGARFQLSHPDGLSEAWASFDPRGKSAHVRVQIVDGVLEVEQPPGDEMPNAIFVVPSGPWATPTGLKLRASAGGQQVLEGTSTVATIPAGPQRNVLLTVGEKGWSFLVDTAHIPVRSGVEVSGFHEDAQDQLRELGYLDDPSQIR